VSKGRALALALAFQLAALLILSQPWFKVSMQLDGSGVELGSFDGATTYPASTPLSLLGLAALSVVAISASKTRFAAILIAVSSTLGALLAIVPLIVTRDISALDGQLDRLTGIANTHGLQDLLIAPTAFASVWMVICAILLVYLIWMLKLSRAWSNQDKAASSRNEKSFAQGSKEKSQPKDSIELWDDQR
jgi:uncharacterized membrane protein (TIGR02234 family)